MKIKFNFASCLIACGVVLFLTTNAEAAQIKKIYRGTVNFDTTDIVQSVAIGGTVDTSKSIVLITMNAAVNTADQNNFFTAQFEDASTITINRSGGTIYASVSWQVIEFASGVSVQRGISSMQAGSLTKSITLASSIDTTKSLPIVYTQNTEAGRTITDQMYLIPTFPNATTLQLDRKASTGTKAINMTWQVIQFLTDTTVYTGSVSFSVPGGNTLNQQVTANQALTNSGNNAMLFQYINPGTATAGQDDEFMVRGTITAGSPATLTFTRNSASSVANHGLDVRWYVVDFNDGTNGLGLIQAGTSNDLFSTNYTSRNINSSTNASPIVVTTSATHGFKANQYVTVASHTVNTNANGTWAITVPTTTTLGLTGSTGNGVGGATGTVVPYPNVVAISSSTDPASPNPIVITTAANHGLTTGQLVNIAGHTTNTNANGQWTVTVTGATTFSLDGSLGTSGTGASAGGATGNVLPAVLVSLGTAIRDDRTITNVSCSGDSSVVDTTTSYIDDLSIVSMLVSVSGTKYVAFNRDVSNTGILAKCAYFTFEFPPLTLNVPNGGETWQIGATQNITWNHADELLTGGTYGGGPHHKCKLEVSVNSGSSYLASTISSNVDCTADTYAWQVPASMSSTDLDVNSLRIKITDTDLAARNTDTSNANFTIKGVLSVVAPNGGETGWNVGTTKTIQWSVTNNTITANLDDNGTVTLKLYSSSGSVLDSTIVTGKTPSAGATGYDWTIGDKVGTAWRVGAEASWDATVSDKSDADLVIKGVLTITAPNGTPSQENWPAQTTQSITWNKSGTFSGGSCGAGEYLGLYYSTNSGGSYPNTIATCQAAGTTSGSYNWSVPVAAISNFSRVRIISDQIAALQIQDDSDADYLVVPSIKVTSPDTGAEVWRVGVANAITWNINGTIPTVKIEYSTDSGSSWVNPPIATGITGATGTYNWSVPDAIGDNVRVKVSDEAAPSTRYDVSDNNFKIRGAISVSAPAGGNVWPVGSSQLIQWSKSGTLGNVDILYSTNGGSSFPNTLTTGNTGTNWSWNPIPDVIGNTVQVRVRSVTYASDTQGDSSNFSIKGSLTVTAPNGSEQWGAGTSHNITWTYTGTLGNIQLLYSTDGGSNFSNTIVSGIAASSSPYSWTLPTTTGTQFRVRAALLSDGTVYDDSNANFSVRGSVALTMPTGGQTWIVGANQNITWTYVGGISNVKLEYSTDSGVNYLAGGLITASTSAAGLSYNWVVPDAIGTHLRVRISDASDATVNDQSSSDFTIKGSLHLTAPDGGETWVVGTSQNITWTKTGTIPNVMLEYSTNGFSNESQTSTITASTSGSALTFPWTIPDAIGSGVKVRISNAGDISVTDNSDNTFGIKGSLTMTAPNGGEAWGIGTSKSITWSKTGTLTGNLKLEYSTNSGSTYPIGNLIDNTVPASSSSYNWTVPDAPGTTARVKVTYLNDTTVNDESDTDFSIKGSLTLTAPNGGQTWIVGESRNITWSKGGTLANVALDYSTDSGATYPNSITASTPGGNLSYAWTIPDNIGSALRVKVTYTGDTSVTDSSDADFAVKGSLTLTSPDGGEVWIVGSSHNITWTKTGTIPNVKLEYSTNGFSDESQTTQIVGSTGGAAGSYAWTIPDAMGSNLKVRITNLSDNSVSDVSNAAFSVKGSFTVSSPNGGETWVVGESRNIVWTMTGSIANAKLEYSTNAFADETQTFSIVTSTTAETNPPVGAGNGQYAWTVADAIGSTNKIRVTNVDDATVFDVSNANFTVKGSVAVTAPNGTEVWDVGSVQNITWSRTGSFANVQIMLSTDGGSTFPTQVVASTPADPVPVDNTGTYAWTIPDSISATSRIRVLNAADSSVQDDSDANFKIRGGLTLNTPNGGEGWVVGSHHNISWSKTGSISTVMLEYSTNGFANESQTTTIATGLNATSGTPYDWTIPSDVSTNVKVRVTNESDATVSDVSNAAFKIMPLFAIVAPNGSEVWTVASSQTISWTTDGSAPNVALDYSTDGGQTYPSSITASTSNTGAYSWTVADAISTSARVRVSSATDAAAFDTSNANFKIRGALLVTAPNGGETWGIGSSHNITWTRTGSLPNVKIEYATNAFADETTTTVIVGSTPADPAPADNNGTYSWTIPDSPTSQARVRVSDASDSTVYDTSNANFYIQGVLTLNIPNGGEVWVVGGTQNVQWTRSGSIANVKLEYSTDAGVTWPGGNLITASTPADPAPFDNVGTYSWTIPDAIGSALRVRVSDASDSSVVDGSDADFRVKGSITVTAPNGGETWYVGASQNITWSKTGSFSNAKLEYSTNGFSDESQTTVITASTTNSGTFSWTIPDAIGANLKVRASDAADATVVDVSNAAFTIKGSLTLTSPNGTEVWKVGENRNITWTKTGTMANVKLEYSTNGGSSYPNTIVASTGAGSGTYAWTVPDAITNQGRVKVTYTSDSSVNDASDSNFEIRGSLTLTAPNGGEVWTVNSLQNVTWTKTGTFSTVKLEYSTNAFADELQTTVIATGIDSVTGTPYSWTVPDAISSTVRVRVTNEADGNVADVSNVNFKIAGSLTLTAPNGGESWAVASSRTVTWTRVGSIANVKLEYSSDSGSTYPNVVVASTGAGAGAYSWTIPDDIGATRRVKISDATDSSIFDTSNADFTIMAGFAVTSPNGGEVWTVGSAHSLTWNTNGTVSNVKLEYSTNAFSDESQTTVITSNTPNTGSYSWTVADAISTLVRIRVSDVNNANAKDISDASFKIRGALLVNAPNGGEAWLIGNSQNIQWTRTGSIANVKLEYSTDAFSDELQTAVIIASTPADPAPADNVGIYAWTIPDTPGTVNKVRVTDASDATVLDTSNANFSIKGQVVMVVPNGSESWAVGTVQNIQWTKFGAITNVQLQYSTDSGSTWPGGNVIVASTAADPAPVDNAGFYSWTIPDSIGTHARVRVQDTLDSSTYDDSNADFKIHGDLVITAPNGGEIWIVGTNHSITWTHAGSFANVALEYSKNGFSDESQTVSITTSTPNNGTFSWSVPDAIGTALKVRASDASDSTVFDTSDTNFTIKGSLTVTSPNGGEVWKVGENRSVTWNRSGSIANVKLEYSTNGGSSYPNLIVASTSAATGTYTWTIPDAIGSQLRVLVSNVSDSTVNDASDANFQIKGTVVVVSPNGGEVWSVNSQHGITWTKTGTYSTVKLEYSTNAFADELQATTIATGVDAATGSPYTWTVPDTIGTQLRIRISNESDATVVDTSDLNFKITGSLTLSAPNGGENWGVGTQKTVTWSRVGSIANVKLEYSTDGGSTYPNVITASTGAGAQAYTWTLPDSIGSNRRVKISDATDSSVFDTSDANFAIMGSFAVTAPNGGEVWTVGSAQSLTWNTTGTVANVKLEYSTNAFSDESQTTSIISSTPNTGTYSWTVADAISNLSRIRVSDVNNANAKDISDASFKIRGALLVTAPNGGEPWEIGTTPDITWTRTGSIANVKLEYSTNGFSDETQTAVITASTPADPAPVDNNGTYTWTIPDTPSTTVKVRVTDASDATVVDTSNANFTVKGRLVLGTPNGGEAWTVAGVQNIQWTKFGSISNVQLQYSTDSGSTWPGGNIIVASTAADPAPIDNAGFYSWTIPDAIGTHLRVRVQDAADSSTYDDSNADFRVRGSIAVTAPNGGEVWIVGSSHNITWNHAGSFSNVKLEYSTNAFADESQTASITTATPNNGSFSWSIPDAIGGSLKVRASDAADNTVVDVSDANFTVKGSLTLTSPNGGEVWKVGENRALTWNRSGSIANVKLEYSTNGGSSYPNVVTASTNASTGTYTWAVADAIGTQLRVRVSDVTDSTVNDTSDANFAVKGTVTMVSPNGGEVWIVNSSHGITWTKTGTYSTVKLEYSTNAFADELQTTVIATGVDSVTGTPYSWTVPDTIGSALRIRVSNESDATVVDTSDLNFKIVGSLTLTAPNGGESWAVGSLKTVTWVRVGSISNAKLEYSTDGGSTYPNVISASTGAGAQAYTWTIPDAIGTTRRVKISDASDSSVSDTSDANFTIMGSFAVTAPNGGEVWTVASGQSVTWNTTGTVSNVKLEYSTNAFSDELQNGTIAANTPNTGTFSWTVADAISNLVRVRVSDVNNANAKDISDASFKIRGALLVSAPNGGEPWEIGTSQNVTWTRTGSVANVKIEYSTNGFADETQTAVIIASTPADPAPADNIGIYAWTIPDTPATTVKVRVTDASDATVLDTSNANFTIKGRLVLSTPNGSDIWTVASVQNIQWTKFGSISNVALQYSTDSGSTWPGGNLIVASTAADPAPIDNVGFYSWTIPDTIGTHLRVRVVDAADSSTYDDSDADFKIKGAITVTSPNGGEVWIVGTNQNITWSHAGSFSNAKLEYSTNGFANESQTVSITTATPNNGTFSWAIPDAIGGTLKVRASDAADSTVNDASDNNFTVKGSLSLTSPNGGEVWKVGENRSVTWNKSGSIANVKLEYSTNGGSTYSNSITASTNANTGTYTWAIPDAIGSQLRVRVSDVTDATVNDTSDANFSVKGTVVVGSPNGGEVWAVNSLHNITWTKTGTYSTVKLEYSTNAFVDELQTTVIATGVDSVNGTPYSWTVPDTIGSTVRVRITNESDATVVDTSDLSFKVVGSLTLTAPNGGENWPVGTLKTITWVRVGSIANAKLEYSTNGGTTYPNVIAASTGAAAQAYIWTIPDAIGSTRRVKISDASDSTVFDTSDANFTILGSFAVTSPNGGEVWTVASGHSVTWNTTGTVSNVKLEYSTNAFSDELQNGTISANTPNTGTFSWTVADAISNLARVRVSDVNNANAFDISDASFKIRGALLVTAPNGGEPWEIGTTQNITWSRTGSVSNVKIEYSTNGFADETQTGVIVASTSAAAGTYAWPIPDAPSTTVKIRVTDASDATVLDTSNANFTIKGRLVMTSPNGSEVWTVSNVQNVQWTKFGAITNVQLQYSTDGGSTWPGGNLIVASTAADPAPADNNGFYSWTIPDAIGTQLRVRVQDAADSSTYDDSDANFKIHGAITMTAPNGGEVWIVGTNNNITWNHAGSFSNAKLEYSSNAFADESQTVVITSATPNSGTYSWSIPDAIGNSLRVRASDAADSTVVDTSDGNFTIKGSLTVTSPNGGEVWKVGENRSVTWNKAGSIANVKLDYSNNGGSTYSNAIVASTNANTGSYTWSIPDSIGQQLRVRVSNVLDSSVNDNSDANFEIKGTVTLATPNGGEQWPVSTTQNITWTKTGTYSSVKLEYSTNAFADELQTTVIATGVDAVTGTPYGWTIPDAIGGNVRVRVTNEADALVTDKSDNNFKIVGSLTVTAPNGGENWNVGTSHTVSWNRVGSIANVKIEYSTDGGSTYPNLVIASTGAGAGAYTWTLPDSIGTNRRVKVTDASDSTVSDTSDANFAIVATFNITAPNGGEVWTVAGTQNITWSTTGSVANVKLEYSTDGGSTYPNLITSSTPNNATYSWTIPDAISSLVKVRISDVNNANGFDTSNAVFKIRGALTVNAPNGGEQWGINTTQTVQWTRTGSIANVKLEYSSNGFADETQTGTIVASTPADPAPADNIGTYGWLIPDAPGLNNKVRVTDVSDSTVLDLSNSAFSIKGSLIITAPNGNEKWIVGSPYNITWIKGGSIANVKLQYSTDSGATWPDPTKVITTSTSAGFLSFTWTIPDDINNKGRVRILDTNDNSVNDTSDADFAIKGSLTITSPNGDEIWTVGDTQNITWTKTGTIANVKLEYSTDSGATFPNSISASTSAAAGTYSWVIPDAISTHVRVKVTQTNDSFVTDSTDSDFKIQGSLRVTSPNGGEVWKVASAQPITWTKTGSISTIKLDYSVNGGANYPNSIATGIDATSGSYSWTIPNAITTNARVKVTDESDSTVNDASDTDFKIAGSITMLSPNGGEKWGIGISQNITWGITGSIASIKLEYSTNAGASYPNLIVASVNAASGSPYAWTVPDAPTSQARIKATNTADATVFDTSDANFKIQGSVTLTSPNGGEAWTVGDSRTITWTKSGSLVNVKLEYSNDGGATYPNLIVASTIADNLAYAWTIPDSVSTNIRVRVTDTGDIEVTDASNADFTIRGAFTLTAPNGGEIWRVGQAQNITWTKVGTINEAKLEYSTNGFADETQTNLIVGTTPAANFSYAWNIPDALSNAVKVRITDVDGVSVGDVSNGNFAIKGTITLTAPNGGESFPVASSTNITWIRTGSFANVKLEYSTNAFADESQSSLITGSTPADPAPVDNTGTYAWTVPDAISTSVKLRVTDANDAATSDISNNVFTIRGILTITSPNGGEKWIVGTSQLITWDRFGSIANVKLQYTTNGTIYTDIVASTPNTGTYPWTIPNSITTTGRVRIYDVSDATVTDTTDANFRIQAGFNITSPNGGENWLVGSSQNITWTTNGTVNFVKLDYSTDSGATFANLVSSSTPNTGTYAWTVADTVAGGVQMRVSDTNDSTAFDISNADFRIRAAFTLVTPNGAEQWRVGRVQNITWVNIGTVANVKLQYSRDGFQADNQTIAASAANTGTYAWTIPDTISNTVRVKVSDVNDIGAFDASNADFRITGDFAVTSPNGGEKWDVDSTHTITWTHAGTVPNAKLEYSTNAGGTWSPIVGLTANNGSYDWTIPDSITASGRVQISDPNDATANDISDSNFKIKAEFALATPNGGEIWTVNEVHAITWTNTGTVNNVKLLYSTDGGSTFPNTIINSVSNTHTYNWTVPDSVSTGVRVRVQSATDVDGFDDSDADFKIRGKIDITAPNGGEQWKIAQSFNITWVSTGTIANVAIRYSTDSGSAYPNIITASTPNGANGATASYAWVLPDVPTTTARIRVTNTADSTVYDDSNADFKIQGFFTLTSPNGGEAWIVNSTHNITWTWGGTIPLAKLSYSSDSGATYPNVINASAPNGAGGGSGSYSWVVPDSISPTSRVKIEDPNDSTVFDSSDADFKISGSFTLASPNGGERWVTNESRNIIWVTNGTIPNVKLTYSHDNFSTSTTIAASAPNANVYNWIVPDPGIANIPKSTKVRVADASDNTVADQSDASFNIDYYYITWDIRDLLTNAALSGLTVKQTKNTDETFIQWQETGISTSPARVQPTPYGVWGTVFSKTGYGDLVVVVTADHDQSFSEFMETTVIHLWLADSRVSYDPVTQKLNVQAWLSRDGSLLAGGALDATYKIFNGSTLLGTYSMDKVISGGVETGYFNKVIDGSPSGINLQSGVVYTTLCEMSIASGGVFKTPSSFEVTQTKTLQDLKNTVDNVLDKPISQVEANIRNDMTTQLTDQKSTLTNLINNQTTLVTTKLDDQKTVLVTKLDEQTNTIKTAIQDFTNKSDSAINKMQDEITRGGIRLIVPGSTKVGTTETIRVAAATGSNPSLDMICPDGTPIMNALPMVETTTQGIYSTEVKFDFRFRCAIAKAVTIVATGSVASKDPANPPVILTAVGSIALTSTDLDTIQGLAAAGLNAEKAAKDAKDAITKVSKALEGNGNVMDALTTLQNNVNKLPSLIGDNKNSMGQMGETVQEVAEKLNGFIGKEGYDMRTILKQEIGEGIKGVRNKVDRTLAATNVMKEIVERKIGKSDEPIIQSFYEIGSVKLRVVAVNPSKEKSQVVPIKIYLPKEVIPDDIIDMGELKVGYDSEKGLYFAYSDGAKLAPQETRVFEVHLEDVWKIPAAETDKVKDQTARALKHLENTEYYDKAKMIVDSIDRRVEDILKRQNDESISREEHIGAYRMNMATMEQIKQDIALIEKMLQHTGAPPSIEFLKDTVFEKKDDIDRITAWKVIFGIIGFLGIIGFGAFVRWFLLFKSRSIPKGVDVDHAPHISESVEEHIGLGPTEVKASEGAEDEKRKAG